jgi:hypothetical protein
MQGWSCDDVYVERHCLDLQQNVLSCWLRVRVCVWGGGARGGEGWLDVQGGGRVGPRECQQWHGGKLEMLAVGVALHGGDHRRQRRSLRDARDALRLWSQHSPPAPAACVCMTVCCRVVFRHALLQAQIWVCHSPAHIPALPACLARLAACVLFQASTCCTTQTCLGCHPPQCWMC